MFFMVLYCIMLKVTNNIVSQFEGVIFARVLLHACADQTTCPALDIYSSFLLKGHAKEEGLV
jgi:hypothetical protein